MATTNQNVETSLMSGADILVQSLVNQGVEVLFAYPGGASMPLHQALRRYASQLRTVLPRHEQGGGFAAQGYARTTGRPGVCIATSGPGATNLVTTIADAKLDSIPLIAITGQVTTPVIGSDAFQETPIVEVCRGISKHHYLVTEVEDLARVVREAFYVATTGRPGPVLIDLPKDVQLNQCVPEWDLPMNLPGYHPNEGSVSVEQVKQVAAAIKLAKQPVLYCGGGIIASGASEILRQFARQLGAPVVMTLMGLGCFPTRDELSMDMLGMHGSVYANWAVRDADLLIALGVRFDDRVTGKLEKFAEHAKIVHVDIDASELNKNKPAHIPIVADAKKFLETLMPELEPEYEFSGWLQQCQQWKRENPYEYDQEFDGILPQHAISELSDLTQDRNTIISVGGQPSIFLSRSREPGCLVAVWEQWDSACRRPWEPRQLTRMRWS